jgi:hypothetical protein
MMGNVEGQRSLKEDLLFREGMTTDNLTLLCCGWEVLIGQVTLPVLLIFIWRGNKITGSLFPSTFYMKAKSE